LQHGFSPDLQALFKFGIISYFGVATQGV